MTIKTTVGPNENEEQLQDDTLVSGVRNSHRGVLSSSKDIQNSQRIEKRFDENNIRNRRSNCLKSKNLKQRYQQSTHRKRDRDRNKVSANDVTSQRFHSVIASKSSIGNQCNNINNSPVSCDKLTSNCGSPDEKFSGYNSGDEHIGQRDSTLTPEEWDKRDTNFVKAISDRGLVVKEIIEDGACLFRAISLQIYGDQEMHESIRQQTMDYIDKNNEYFAQFVTEDIHSYISRKRHNHVHGNHIEIQAMSEIYNRPVELYCYEMEPINIFNSEQINNGYEPLRLSYQRCSHYNAIINPLKASVGVGLGLAGYRPDEFPEYKQLKDAVRQSEEQEIEQTMFEDKLKTTDWEATNEAIEEQIARESYLQWCRDNLKKAETNLRSTTTSSSSTVTSTAVSSTIVTPESLAAQVGLINDEDELNSQISPELATESSGSSSKDAYRLTFREFLGSQIHPRRRRLRHNNNQNSPSFRKKQKLSRTCLEEQLPTNNNLDNLAPSTSSRIDDDTAGAVDQSPLSVFHQSLLESSYSNNGVGQLSEHEMVQKALQLSRMDYINSNSRNTNCIDEDYDSSP